uniref:NAC domain-containing protein n=1 Tax=Setaria viridis TaxID=4556 RepID=A0A4U6T9R6_SETVI|nr:hypothetical protein SEVIR_9G576300v2 [Setaria viridis]
MDRRRPVIGLLRDVESRLPPGFRFHPTDVELISYYLRAKVADNQQTKHQQQPPATTMVFEVDLHEREPWELPVAAKVSGNEWYFFSYRDRKYATGSRTNRATKLGYWKATRKDKVIHHHDHQEPAAAAAAGMVIGTRKTLVFYFGRAPNGRKSGWVMHEFRLLPRLMLLVDAMAPHHLHHPAATLLQQAQHTTSSSNFDFSDCLTGDEIGLAGCGGNCTMEMVLLQDGSYDHDGVYYF